LSAAAVLALCGGIGAASALAQSAPAAGGGQENTRIGQYRFALQPSKQGKQQGSGENQVYEINRNDDKVRVEIVDGEVVRAERNGEEIPLERVEHDGGSIRILGDDGAVVFNVMPSAPPRAPQPPRSPRAPQAVRGMAGAHGETAISGLRRYYTGEGTVRGWSLGGEEGAQAGQPTEAPKVMIGVVMADAEGSLARHFDLEPGSVTMIGQVYEGFPASRAGLRASDLIIEVEGEPPADQARIREVLGEKSPGDTLELTVIQRGERKNIRVELEAYDAERLSESRPDMPEGWDQFGTPVAPEVPLLLERLKEGAKVDRAGRAQRAAGRPPVERAREALERDHLLLLEAAKGARAEDVSKHLNELFGERAERMEEVMKRFGATREQSDERIRRIEEQMDRLEQMLERLVEEREGGGRGR
jgi:hypothetical protein